jgi:hypothetical protein
VTPEEAVEINAASGTAYWNDDQGYPNAGSVEDFVCEANRAAEDGGVYEYVSGPGVPNVWRSRAGQYLRRLRRLDSRRKHAEVSR